MKILAIFVSTKANFSWFSFRPYEDYKALTPPRTWQAQP